MVRIVVIAFFVFVSSFAIGQKSLSGNLYRSIGLATNSEFDVFDANYGAQLVYQFDVNKINWEAGVDIRVIDWGNQVGVFVGNNWDLYDKGKSNIAFNYRIHLNVPLFYNDFLLGYGLSSNLSYNFNLFRSFDLKLGVGLRYDSVPGYRDYGPIFSTFELPITLGIKKTLGGKETLE